jgi:hypothetical protein
VTAPWISLAPVSKLTQSASDIFCFIKR